MKFIGRETERKRIHKLTENQEMSSALIYGRRRVGKSELIKQCLRESKLKSIYYECKQTAELSNVASLSEIISEVFGFPPLSFNSFESCLEYSTLNITVLLNCLGKRFSSQQGRSVHE